MRRALLPEPVLDRLLGLAGEAGLSLRLRVDLEGEATFHVQGLGSFDEVEPLEHALRDRIGALT